MTIVAAVQHDIVWEDSAATLAALATDVAAAAGAGAQLIVLTEMFATGFSMQVERTAQSEDGEIVTWMRDQAGLHDVRLVGSAAVRDDANEQPTNRLLIVGPQGVEYRYDKIHPFTYAKEHERFAAGSQPVVAEVDGMNWAMTVCYDLRFANLYWDLAPQVDGYLVVANWPRPRGEHWKALLVARAIENQAWVVGVNRVGQGGGLDYAGGSMVIDPLGQVIASASESPAMIVTSVDQTTVTSVRERFPFLADRRRTDWSGG
ncbi:MAG: nitrilase-related carbon-nitrogen hydrolase [Nitriliruptoraceae bacterium]